MKELLPYIALQREQFIKIFPDRPVGIHELSFLEEHSIRINLSEGSIWGWVKDEYWQELKELLGVGGKG